MIQADEIDFDDLMWQYALWSFIDSGFVRGYISAGGASSGTPNITAEQAELIDKALSMWEPARERDKRLFKKRYFAPMLDESGYKVPQSPEMLSIQWHLTVTEINGIIDAGLNAVESHYFDLLGRGKKVLTLYK